jgi:cytohesin
MFSIIKYIFKLSINRACKNGNIETVKLHLAAGRDVNAKDIFQCSPLHDAVYGCQKEIIELLIEKGANLNEKDAFGKTALHEAVRKGQKEIVELLITEGADVNGNRKAGTPLEEAVFKGHTQIAQLLISKGADVNAKLSLKFTGWTLLDVALEKKGRTEIADLLRKHGGKTKKELEAAGK